MERKVGEIFEYNGEWYQCIHTKSLGCENCDLATKSDIHCSDVFEIRGEITVNCNWIRRLCLLYLQKRRSMFKWWYMQK